MKRVIAAIAVVSVLAAAAFGISTFQKKVEVTTGTKTVCTYGHTVSDDIETIEVRADEVGSYGVKTETVVCDRHTKLEALYGEAQKALESGDLDLAKAKLAEVIAIDKTFAKAQAQLDDISGGKDPVPDQTSPSPGEQTTKPESPGEGDTTGPSGSLKGWMPDTLPGFTGNKPIVDVLTIARTYKPEDGSKARTFVIVAEQFRTPADAAKALDARIKNVYPKDAGTLKINGHSIYFGTDSSLIAAAGLTDGSVMVAMEMSTQDKVAPKELKGLIEKVLNELP